MTLKLMRENLSRHHRHNRHDDDDGCDESCPKTRFVRPCGPNLEVDSTSGCSLKSEWLTSKEAAEYLRLSVKALRNKTSDGQIPFHKLGRLNRYRKEELESLLLSQKRGNRYGNQT